MRDRTVICFRALVFIGSLLTVVACDNHAVDPPTNTAPAWDFGDLTGSYEGTVQGPGDALGDAGEAVLTIEQAEEGIAGVMILVAEFGEGPEAVSFEFGSAYTGVVTHELQPHVTLFLENPNCGGITEFGGTYAPSESSLDLAGRYVHRNADGCETIATLDLTVSVHKSN